MVLKCNKLIKDMRESPSSLEFILSILWSKCQTVARVLWTLTRIRKCDISYLGFTTACINEKRIIIWKSTLDFLCMYIICTIYRLHIYITYWGPGYQNRAHTQLTQTRYFASYQNEIIHSISYFMNINSCFSWVKYHKTKTNT